MMSDDTTREEELEHAYASKDPKRILAAERKVAGVSAAKRGLPAPHRCICPICRRELKP